MKITPGIHTNNLARTRAYNDSIGQHNSRKPYISTHQNQQRLHHIAASRGQAIKRPTTSDLRSWRLLDVQNVTFSIVPNRTVAAGNHDDQSPPNSGSFPGQSLTAVRPSAHPPAHAMPLLPSAIVAQNTTLNPPQASGSSASLSSPPPARLCEQLLEEGLPPPARLTKRQPEPVVQRVNRAVTTLLKEQSCIGHDIALSPSQLITVTRRPSSPDTATEQTQELFVRIDPATGERFGARMVTKADKLSLASRLRNILQQGLGGKGAPQQGKAWAQQPANRGDSDVNVGAGSSGMSTAKKTLSKDQLAKWQQWEKGTPPGSTENRSEALHRVMASAESTRNHLDLSGLALTALPERLPLPSHITMVDVSKNNLMTLPTDLPETLRSLDASDNELTALPPLPPLEELNVSLNHLTELNSELPSTLISLRVSENHLTDLPASLPNNLKYLDTSSNHLTDLPESLPNNLEYVDASSNQLRSLPERLPENLQTIKLVNNRVMTFPDTWPRDIKTVDLSDNNLDGLDESILALSHRAEVIMYRNIFSDVIRQKLHYPTANSRFFNHQIQLEAPTPRLPPTLTEQEFITLWQEWGKAKPVEAADNRVEAIARMHACLAQGAEWLNLNHLQLSSLPSVLPPSITKLNLSGCRMNTLPSTLPATLTELDLRNSHITHFTPPWPPNLERLVLANTPINTASLPPFPATLQSLDISNTGVHALPPLPHNLRVLKASGCPLGSHGVDWAQLPASIEYLTLDRCGLTHLPAHFSSNLRELSLKDNDLSTINLSAKRLRHLNISGQQRDSTTARTPLTFSGPLPNGLASFDASSNHLTTLPETWPAALRHLNLRNNQLTALPETWPAALNSLGLTNNQLTALPETLPASLNSLGLTNNQLTALPATLPATLSRLTLTNNQLTALPETLPATLSSLDLTNNQLTALPETLPATLSSLDLTNNQLTALPETLPATLRSLFLTNNQLTELPANLPQRLHTLTVNNNRLTRLPETIVNLPATLRISIENNPLTDRTVQSLQTLVSQPGYQGPVIHFSMMDHAAPRPVRPLDDAVASWLGADKAARWHTMVQETDATSFSQFLDRLASTLSVEHHADVKQRIAVWLNQLADTPELRQQTFALAQGATATCEDRVTCTFNQMQKARVVHDVASGTYDQQLDKLVTLGREMFRLEQLEAIARTKVNRLRFVDEIEVYLAYEVKLRDSLKLTTVAPEMRFYGVSHVTQEDLESARAQVMQSENDHFHDWFVQWSPWHNALQRRDAVRFNMAQEKRRTFVDSGDFDKQVKEQLEKQALPDDVETRTALGKKVLDDFDQEIYRQLTEHELGKTHSRHLLHPVWHE